MTTKTIVTVDELAKFLKVSKSTIYRMIKDNHIPIGDVRSGYRFILEDVLKAIFSTKRGKNGKAKAS